MRGEGERGLSYTRFLSQGKQGERANGDNRTRTAKVKGVSGQAERREGARES